MSGHKSIRFFLPVIEALKGESQLALSYLQRAIKLNQSLYRALARGDTHFQSLLQAQQLQTFLQRQG